MQGNHANAPILVLGLGNLLLQDEGLGVRAVQQLQTEMGDPEGVLLLDGGTLGLDLLPYLDGVTHLLILDAVDVGQPAGTLVRLADSEIPAALAPSMSMHQVGLQELLAIASLHGNLPERVLLLGIQPQSVSWGTDLSPIVETTLGRLVHEAQDVILGWLEAERQGTRVMQR